MDRSIATLYDDDGTLNTIWIDDDISAVEGLMNSHLSVRYPVPVTADDDADLLRSLAMDLFMAQAYRRLASAPTPETISAAAEQARKHLTRLATGELKLSAASETVAGTVRGANMTLIANDPQMTRARLRGF